MGNQEAVLAYEQELGQKTDNGYARAMKQVGRFHAACGRFEEARSWYESAAATYEEIEGPLHVWPQRYREDLAVLLEKSLNADDEAAAIREGKQLQSERPPFTRERR